MKIGKIGDGSFFAMKRLCSPTCIFVGIASLALGWRFVSVPWDFGGCFFQLWVAAVGASFFSQLYPRMGRMGRLVAGATLFPVGALLLFGTVYFAPQALNPFLFLAFALAGALVLWSVPGMRVAFLVFLVCLWRSVSSSKSQERDRLEKCRLREGTIRKTFLAVSVALLLLLIPLGAYCRYGFGHMAMVVGLRSLRPDAVAELRFAPVASGSAAVVVSKRDSVAEIVRAFRKTTPYSPNHDGIEQAWRLTVVMQDGSSIEFRIGNGNRAHPSFVWVEFGVEVYQNSALREALRAAGIDLWGRPDGSGTGEILHSRSRLSS